MDEENLCPAKLPHACRKGKSVFLWHKVLCRQGVPQEIIFLSIGLCLTVPLTCPNSQSAAWSWLFDPFQLGRPSKLHSQPSLKSVPSVRPSLPPPRQVRLTNLTLDLISHPPPPGLSPHSFLPDCICFSLSSRRTPSGARGRSAPTATPPPPRSGGGTGPASRCATPADSTTSCTGYVETWCSNNHNIKRSCFTTAKSLYGNVR